MTDPGGEMGGPTDERLDALLGALRAEGFEDPDREAAWGRLARGECGGAERASLQAEDPERYALFAPPDPAFHERVRRSITPGSRRDWFDWRWAVPIAALAVLLVAPRLVTQPTLAVPYQLELSEGDLPERGAEDPVEVPNFSEGGLFWLTLRPGTAVAEPVDAALFLRRGELLLPIALAPEHRLAPGQGVLEIEAPVGELGISPGRYELVVAVGYRGGLPDEAALRAALHDGGESPWQIFSREVAFVGEDPGR